MEILWHLTRADENDEDLPAKDTECVFEAEGVIHCGDEEAGEIGVTYVFAERPASNEAFLWLWDVVGATCAVYEEICAPDRNGFRKPLPDLLGYATGILCIHYIALKPAFRGRGIGREVVREAVRQFADTRVGAVLLDFSPLQHRHGGYDDFFDEARELPFNHPEDDHGRLARHFEGWGMERMSGTHFMAAAPSVLCDELNPDWFPGLLE